MNELASLGERIAEATAREPRLMTPVLASRLGVTEAELLAQWPDDTVTMLDSARIPDIIRALEALGTMHVICRNAACVLEAHGTFGGFSVAGPYFNVLTDTLDMHIQVERITAAFAVIKPSHMTGEQTHSVQFFSTDGSSAFKAFLYASQSASVSGSHAERVAAWAKLRDEFAAARAASGTA